MSRCDVTGCTGVVSHDLCVGYEPILRLCSDHAEKLETVVTPTQTVTDIPVVYLGEG